MKYELKQVASGYWMLTCTKHGEERPVAAFWFESEDNAIFAMQMASIHRTDLDALKFLAEAIHDDRAWCPLVLREEGVGYDGTGPEDQAWLWNVYPPGQYDKDALADNSFWTLEEAINHAEEAQRKGP